MCLLPSRSAKKVEDHVAGEARQRRSNIIAAPRHQASGTVSKARFRGGPATRASNNTAAVVAATSAGAAVGGLKDVEVAGGVEMARTEMRVVVRTVYHGSHNHPPPPPDGSSTRLLCSSPPFPAAATCTSVTTLAPVTPGPAATAWTLVPAPPLATCASTTTCTPAAATTCTLAAATACTTDPAALPLPDVSSTSPLSQSSATSFAPATSPFPPTTLPCALATSCGPLTTCAPTTTWSLASHSHPAITSTAVGATTCARPAATLPPFTMTFLLAMSYPEDVAHPVLYGTTILLPSPGTEAVPSSASLT
ncbi:unnamed protein product [Closterium sp. NIES-53]